MLRPLVVVPVVFMVLMVVSATTIRVTNVVDLFACVVVVSFMVLMTTEVVAMAVMAKHSNHDDVHKESERRHHEHDFAIDRVVAGVDEPAHGLVQEHARHEPDELDGHERAQDLEAEEAIRLDGRRLPARRPDRKQRDGEARDVGEQVRSIGQHGQAVGVQSAHDLNEHEEEAEGRRAAQLARRVRPLGPVCRLPRHILEPAFLEVVCAPHVTSSSLFLEVVNCVGHFMFPSSFLLHTSSSPHRAAPSINSRNKFPL